MEHTVLRFVPHVGRGLVLLREGEIDSDTQSSSRERLQQLYALAFFENGKLVPHATTGATVHRCVSIAPLVRHSSALRSMLDGRRRAAVISSEDGPTSWFQGGDARFLEDAMDRAHLERFLLLCAQPHAFDRIRADLLEPDDRVAEVATAKTPATHVTPPSPRRLIPAPSIPEA